jgi:hypothetical protein
MEVEELIRRARKCMPYLSDEWAQSVRAANYSRPKDRQRLEKLERLILEIEEIAARERARG